MTLSSITVECRRCGHAFPVPRTLIVTGNWQRGCPVCHPPDEPQTEALNRKAA